MPILLPGLWDSTRAPVVSFIPEPCSLHFFAQKKTLCPGLTWAPRSKDPEDTWGASNRKPQDLQTLATGLVALSSPRLRGWVLVTRYWWGKTNTQDYFFPQLWSVPKKGELQKVSCTSGSYLYFKKKKLHTHTHTSKQSIFERLRAVKNVLNQPIYI